MPSRLATVSLQEGVTGQSSSVVWVPVSVTLAVKTRSTSTLGCQHSLDYLTQ